MSETKGDEFPFTTPAESDARMFIQWKGTDICLDFYCKCGANCHFDGEFAYFLQCPHCGAVYEMGTQVIAKHTASPASAPRIMERDGRVRPDRDESWRP